MVPYLVKVLQAVWHAEVSMKSDGPARRKQGSKHLASKAHLRREIRPRTPSISRGTPAPSSNLRPHKRDVPGRRCRQFHFYPVSRGRTRFDRSIPRRSGFRHSTADSLGAVAEYDTRLSRCYNPHPADGAMCECVRGGTWSRCIFHRVQRRNIWWHTSLLSASRDMFWSAA